VYSLFEVLSLLSDIPMEKMQVKAVEGNGYKRLDNEFVNIEVNMLRTLKDASITDRTPILVDMKDVNELKKLFPDEYSPIKENTGDEAADGDDPNAIPN